MSKKNKKAAWKRRNQQALILEKKRLEELAKKKKPKKVVVKGKNLKRMGIIPKNQKLQKIKRTVDDMTDDGERQQQGPSKRRRVTPKKEEDENKMEDVAKGLGERDVEDTPIAAWVGKELQYDWSTKKKFQVRCILSRRSCATNSLIVVAQSCRAIDRRNLKKHWV